MKYLKFFIIISIFTNLFSMENQDDITELKVCLTGTRDNQFLINLEPSEKPSDEYLSMLLYGAALKNKIDVVKEILKANNVDVNYHGDIKLNTPLIVAIELGHRDIAMMLLEHPNIKIDLANFNGKTPLLATKGYGYNIDLIRVLINKGANLKKICHRDGSNLLHTAVLNVVLFSDNVVNLVKLIVFKCPELANMEDDAHQTPLNIARNLCQKYRSRELLEIIDILCKLEVSKDN